jgi:hypothetical protein
MGTSQDSVDDHDSQLRLSEFAATPLVGFVVSAAAGALTALALVGAIFIGALFVAPISQRNSLREQIIGTTGDVEFSG